MFSQGIGYNRVYQNDNSKRDIVIIDDLSPRIDVDYTIPILSVDTKTHLYNTTLTPIIFKNINYNIGDKFFITGKSNESITAQYFFEIRKFDSLKFTNGVDDLYTTIEKITVCKGQTVELTYIGENTFVYTTYNSNTYHFCGMKYRTLAGGVLFPEVLYGNMNLESYDNLAAGQNRLFFKNDNTLFKSTINATPSIIHDDEFNRIAFVNVDYKLIDDTARIILINTFYLNLNDMSIVYSDEILTKWDVTIEFKTVL